MNCGDHCNTFKVEDEVVVKRELHAMFNSTHEEADSRMLFRISSVQATTRQCCDKNDRYKRACNHTGKLTAFICTARNRG